MNREDAWGAQEERHFLLSPRGGGRGGFFGWGQGGVLPSRPLRLRGLTIPMLIKVAQNAPQ